MYSSVGNILQHTLLQYVAYSTVHPVPISAPEQWTQPLEQRGRAVVSCVCGFLQPEPVQVGDSAQMSVVLLLIKTKLFYLQAKSST